MDRRLAIVSLSVVALAMAPSAASAQPLIVLDAGHGGTDPGAVGCSLEEANVVLDVTQRLQVLLEAAGVRVALTRTDDTFVGLTERAAFANARGADGFVSIHSNANSGTPATGTETFVYPGAGARTRELGGLVQREMIEAWMLRDRGLKEGNFAVLRETSMPAALGELAFTNNCSVDAVLLADPDARQRMAEAYRDAILEWLGIDPTMVDGELRGIVFEDQGVGLEDVTVRVPGATVRVVETGATAAASDVEGGFSFRLPPGAYTLEATHDGHLTAMRTCNVSAGVPTDCSIGMLPETSTGDAGPVERDASTGDAGARTDAGPGREPVDGCSCRVGASRGDGAALVALAVALAIALRRRRHSGK